MSSHPATPESTPGTTPRATQEGDTAVAIEPAHEDGDPAPFADLQNPYVRRWLQSSKAGVTFYFTDATHQTFLEGVNSKKEAPRSKRFLCATGDFIDILTTFNAEKSVSKGQWTFTLTKEQSTRIFWVQGKHVTGENCNLQEIDWSKKPWKDSLTRDGIVLSGFELSSRFHLGICRCNLSIPPKSGATSDELAWQDKLRKFIDIIEMEKTTQLDQWPASHLPQPFGDTQTENWKKLPIVFWAKPSLDDPASGTPSASSHGRYNAAPSFAWTPTNAMHHTAYPMHNWVYSQAQRPAYYQSWPY